MYSQPCRGCRRSCSFLTLHREYNAPYAPYSRQPQGVEGAGHSLPRQNAAGEGERRQREESRWRQRGAQASGEDDFQRRPRAAVSEAVGRVPRSLARSLAHSQTLSLSVFLSLNLSPSISNLRPYLARAAPSSPGCAYSSSPASRASSCHTSYSRKRSRSSRAVSGRMMWCTSRRPTNPRWWRMRRPSRRSWRRSTRRLTVRERVCCRVLYQRWRPPHHPTRPPYLYPTPLHQTIHHHPTPNHSTRPDDPHQHQHHHHHHHQPVR